jgi:hypothetical protein
MRKYVSPLLISLSVSVLFACEKENKEVEKEIIQHDMTAVTGPASGAVNEGVPLSVTYTSLNGCDSIDTFTQVPAANTVSVRAFSYALSPNTVCTQALSTRTKVFNFVSSSKGTFELRFYKTDNSFFTHTLTIN